VNAIVGAVGFDRAALPDLRLINHGGAAMPVALMERALEKLPGLALLEHYGQSEAGAIAARPPAAARAKPTSVGRPIPGLAINFRDPAGAPTAAGTAGELVLRGPGVFRRYLDDPAETAKAFTADGWLKTGDIGYLDAEGDLFLVDRAKDLIIAGGENIYPAEIENVLFSHPAVAECAVFAIPDDHWGEVPAAHVVLAGGARASEQELIDHVAARIARHKRPRLVKFVDVLPKTAIGKVQKNLIREAYWRGIVGKP
jgi:acyl-CoA synthetase (AMP-forming)/AMP-acid ligase II